MSTALSTKNFKVAPFETTHYRKPVTWYTVKCLKCGSSNEYRRAEAVINGRRKHLCPPSRRNLPGARQIMAGGSAWRTRLDLRVGDYVWCPYYYADTIGRVTDLSGGDYDGPVKTITSLAPYWPS